MQGGAHQGRRGATPMPVTATNNSNHQEPAAANSQQPAASSLLPTDETFLSVGFHQPQPFLNFLIGTQPLLDFLRRTVTLQPWGVGWG